MHTGDDAQASAFSVVPGEAPAAPQSGPVPCLGIVYPRDSDRCFELGVAPCTIGSGQNADIILNDDRVAPIHCRVSLHGGEVQVEDLGSPMGTRIDDRPIAGARLEPGQLLQVGRFRLALGRSAAGRRNGRAVSSQRPALDTATGMPGRAWILHRAEAMLEARSDSPLPLTFAVLAPDRPNGAGGRDGAGFGDQLLRRVGRLVEGQLRGKEVLGLVGSEKFLLLLPEVDSPDAALRLERLCRAVRLQRFRLDGGELRTTLSIGFATRAGCEAGSPGRLLTLAERALYRARQWGGDQAITLDP